MKLPKSFTTVTRFSKTVALFLFIVLPFVGFYLGTIYQKLVDQTTQYSQMQLHQTIMPTQVPEQIISAPSLTSDWKTFYSPRSMKETNIVYSIKYPTDWYENTKNLADSGPNVIFTPTPVSDVGEHNTACVSLYGGVFVSTANNIEGDIKSWDRQTVGSIKALEIKNIQVGPLHGIKRKITIYPVNGSPFEGIESILIGKANTINDPKGKNLYVISSCRNTSEEQYDQILSTFKGQ